MSKVLRIAYLFLAVSTSSVVEASVEKSLNNLVSAVKQLALNLDGQIRNTIKKQTETLSSLETVTSSVTSVKSSVTSVKSAVSTVQSSVKTVSRQLDSVPEQINKQFSAELNTKMTPLYSVFDDIKKIPKQVGNMISGGVEDILTMGIEALEEIGLDKIEEAFGLDIKQSYDNELIDDCLSLFSPKLAQSLADMKWQNGDDKSSPLYGLANKTITAAFYPIKCQLCHKLLKSCQNCPSDLYDDVPGNEIENRRLTSEHLWMAIDNFGPTYLRGSGNKDDEKAFTAGVRNRDKTGGMDNTANAAAMGSARRELDEAAMTCAQDSKSAIGYSQKRDFFYSILMSPLTVSAYPDFRFDFDSGECNKFDVNEMVTLPAGNLDTWDTRTNQNIVAAVLLAEAAVDTVTTTLAMLCEAMPENVCIGGCGSNPLKPLCWGISATGQFVGQFFELLKSGIDLHDGVIDGAEIQATLSNSETLIEKTCELEALIRDNAAETAQGTRALAETVSTAAQNLVSEQLEVVSAQSDAVIDLITKEAEITRMQAQEAGTTQELIKNALSMEIKLLQKDAVQAKFIVASTSHDNGASRVAVSAVYAVADNNSEDNGGVVLSDLTFDSFSLGSGILHIRADLAGIENAEITMFAMKAGVDFNGVAYETTKLVPM